MLLRAGRVLGAGGSTLYRRDPAGRAAVLRRRHEAGWAFAWRSLMAGELLVIIAQQPALGVG